MIEWATPTWLPFVCGQCGYAHLEVRYGMVGYLEMPFFRTEAHKGVNNCPHCDSRLICSANVQYGGE